MRNFRVQLDRRGKVSEFVRCMDKLIEEAMFKSNEAQKKL